MWAGGALIAVIFFGIIYIIYAIKIFFLRKKHKKMMDELQQILEEKENEQ